MDILEQIQPIFRDILDNEELVLTRESKADNVEGWDSLAHVHIVMAVGKHFGVRFGLDDLQSMKNVGDMCDLISRKLAEKQ